MERRDRKAFRAFDEGSPNFGSAVENSGITYVTRLGSSRFRKAYRRAGSRAPKPIVLELSCNARSASQRLSDERD